MWHHTLNYISPKKLNHVFLVCLVNAYFTHTNRYWVPMQRNILLNFINMIDNKISKVHDMTQFKEISKHINIILMK